MTQHPLQSCMAERTGRKRKTPGESNNITSLSELTGRVILSLGRNEKFYQFGSNAFRKSTLHRVFV